MSTNENLVGIDSKCFKIKTAKGSLISKRFELEYEDVGHKYRHVKECDICYQNSAGDIIDLCSVEYDEETKCFKINVFSDPTHEDCTHSFEIKEKELQF